MLQITNLFKAAFKSIMKNRMRSLLTSLGIIIGVSAVIVMVGIGSGSQQRIAQEISSFGNNMIVVFPSFSQRGGVNRGAGSFNRLTMDDVDAIREEATLCKYISAIVMSSGQVIGNGNNWSTSIQGVDPDYQQIRMWELESGEFFTEKDIRSRKKVAVLGHTVVENIFGDMDPVGQKIRIRNTPFKVIGVLKEKGQDSRGQDQDDIIFAPSSTVLLRLKGDRYINMINASANSLEIISKAQEELSEILRHEHKIEYGQEDDFRVANQTAITEMASETSRIMTMLLGAVAGVSLVVGGIGIMNIMLANIYERTKEIGTLRALGAQRRTILTQFLFEAVTLTGLGGVLGVAIGFLIALLIKYSAGMPTVVTPISVFVALTVSVLTGIIFGTHPAWKAANLSPIEALRR